MTKKLNKVPLFEGTEWDIDMLHRMWAEIDEIGKRLGLDYYEPQIELISAEQMLDAYSSHAMPQMYNHWSFGKSFLKSENSYKKGRSGLAYEVVINTNPSIAYLMETNTATLQALTIAHSICGHATFFKTNYMFTDWTDADTILDYMNFAKKYVQKCEEKYGEDRVEKLLDSCHALMYQGVDKYNKPHITEERERLREMSREAHSQDTFDDVWRTLPVNKRRSMEKFFEEMKELKDQGETHTEYSEENILYFIEKYSPVLEDWEREVVRIVRKVSQYFYPQMQTSLMNEGFACLIHHTIMTELHEQGSLTDGAYIEFLASHANVVMQRPWNSEYYGGINVYALGYAMMTDIKRMCIAPTDEDREWFPELCDTDWMTTIKGIVRNYRDESFILQFLSPKVIRDLQLFSVNYEEDEEFMTVSAVQCTEDVKHIRKILADQYDLSNKIPHVEVSSVDWKDTRALELSFISRNGVLLNYNAAKDTMQHVHELWGMPVGMCYYDYTGKRIEEV